MGPSLNSWSSQRLAGCICMTLPTSSRKGSYHFHTWPGTTYSCCWQDSNSLHVWWSYSPQEHFQHKSDLPYRLHTTHHKSQNKLVHLKGKFSKVVQLPMQKVSNNKIGTSGNFNPFFKQLRTSFIGDHFFYSYEFNVWFRSVIFVRRNQMLYNL